MKKILDVNNLHVSFYSHQKIIRAVRGISFSLYEKQKLAIVGESGSGKSAAMKALLKLLPHNTSKVTEGNAMYGGVNLLALSENNIRKFRGKDIGFIFQDPMTSLNPTMKVGKQLFESYRMHHPHVCQEAAYKKILEFLDLVGIPNPKDRYEQYPFELSGGMCQRIMIALALLPEPKILIADEPTTALDVTIQSQILTLLNDIQSRLEMSIIFITHDLSLISGFCDYALVMYAGEIVESSTVSDLFYAPKHPYTKRLLRAIPTIDSKAKRTLVPIEGNMPDLSREIHGCSFFDRCPKAMHICKENTPPFFSNQTSSKCRCWLYDVRNKSVKMEETTV